MVLNYTPSDRPSKIIITVTPSTILGHPLTVISHKLGVLKYQRSLCDPHSTSNGFWREFNISPVASLSVPFGFLFIKDMASSIYKNEGLLGFFRGLPEELAYRILKDVLKYLIPNFVLPIYSSIKSKIINNSRVYSIFENDISRKFRDRWYLAMSSDTFITRFINFYKRLIEKDINNIISSFIIELITYPILTIISRLIIYDGYGPVSFISLLKNSIKVDGLFSLYRGLMFYFIANSLNYIPKNFSKFVKHCIIEDYYISSMFEQIFPMIVSVIVSALSQTSLILRCGTNIDGFCVKEQSIEIFRNMPWVAIFLNIILGMVLLQTREKMLAKHIDELKSKLKN